MKEKGSRVLFYGSLCVASYTHFYLYSIYRKEKEKNLK